ncbi:MAG: ATP-dependent protease La [Capsulimonas sp.]|nr:ATP-dependent protease La [Capsulimonas sp.]
MSENSKIKNAKAEAKTEAPEQIKDNDQVTIETGGEGDIADQIVKQINGEGEGVPPIPEELSLLPLRDTVIFPVLVAPIAVGRDNSVKLVDEAVAGGNRIIAVSAMRDSSIENPTAKDIYPIGVAVVVRMMAKSTDGIRMIVQGVSRIQIQEVLDEEPYLKARVKVIDPIPVAPEDAVEIEALRRSIADLFRKIVQLSAQMPDELTSLTTSVDDPGVMTDLVAAHMPVEAAAKQEILEKIDLKERMTALLTIMTKELQVLELGSKLQSQVSSEMGKTQRDYYLREQLKAIQKELGEGDERGEELDELRKKIEEAGLPEDALKEATRELDRLQRMSPGAPEYTSARSYVDWMAALPWAISTPDNLDIPEVKAVLDSDHYGLEKVKDRILEYLSVRKFKSEGDLRQPILCLVGPPGVGKTSLGKSIARAMGKKFVRISLGGVHDESEIRGHRRTYIGALPGQIVQGLKRAETNNPLFMLDEIDKINADFRGDPSSALLEVLDPEQNSTFRDNYLDVNFDLSKVLFVTTANMLDTIQPALRDRMEIIELSGYTEEEKVEIAKRHLIPKQVGEHGLTTEQLSFTEEGVKAVVRGHTREAGVRNLERELATICRKATRAFAEGRTEPVVVDKAKVEDYLGAPRFEYEEIAERTEQPGVVTGLVWTPVGGDVVFIEASRMNGGHGLQLTGQLGDVMKESAQTALSYVRAHAAALGVKPDFYEKSDLHIHVPAGGVPKDGPSAGVTMTSAIASLLSGRPIKPALAMTGEVTLSGKVLPVGGIKEKVLAARRAGIKTIILPERNRKDLMEDIPAELRKDMTFIFAKNVQDVIDNALVPMDQVRKGKGKDKKNGHAKLKTSESAPPAPEAVANVPYNA